MLFVAALVLLIVVGSLTQRLVYGPGRDYKELLGPIGIAITEVLAILVPALLFMRARRLANAPVPFMQLSPIGPGGPGSARALQLIFAGLGGALWGLGFFYVLSVFVEPLLEHFIPVPPEERAHLLRLLHPATGLRPLWQDLFCFAAVPAFCEELLFRGALLSTLGARFDAAPWHRATVRAVLISAVLFGVFHLSYSKIIPTAILGLGFGASCVLARSLWASILMHATNNALVVVLVRAGFEEAPKQLGAPQISIAAAAIAALGYILLRRAAPRRAAKIKEDQRRSEKIKTDS